MQRIAVVFLLSCLAAPTGAWAGTILFGGSGTGSDGVVLNAEALFKIDGNTLKIKLRNTGDTSGTSRDKSANTLTGVFFDLPTGITLAPTAAKIASGDLLQPETCLPVPCSATTTNVGGEFTYQTGSWSGHTGADRGISSSGYIDAYVGGGNFNGPNLDDPDSPDGINFGIVAPLAQSPLNPNPGNLQDNPLIEGEVVFTLAISGGTLLESEISNVSFQYGTSLSEPKFKSTTVIITPPPTPEPAAFLLLAPAAFALRRRMRAGGAPPAAAR